MTRRVLLFTTLGLLAWAPVGCHHSEGADTTPASAVAPSAGPPEATSLVDAGTASVETPPPPKETAAPVTPDASTPAASPPDMSAAPDYPPSALYETFSNAESKLVACYLPGKKRNPKLRGNVTVKLTIKGDGSANPVVNQGSNLEDPAVIACVIRTVKTLRFKKPVEGSVTVTYPLIFRPTGDVTLVLPDAGKP